MAPGRKSGSKGETETNELSLGDLVLAKIKGFPAWPAKISRAEDWKQAPDPKTYCVQFFGTSEIGFVAPADIQAFTDEAKSKVSARCQRKTDKYFAKAVKEICEEFENRNGVRNNTLNLSPILEVGPSNVCSKESKIRPKLKSGQGRKRKNEVMMQNDGASREIQTKTVPPMDGIVIGLPAFSKAEVEKLLAKRKRSQERAKTRKDSEGKDQNHNKVLPKKKKDALHEHKRGDSKACSSSLKASKRSDSGTKEPGYSYNEDGLPQAKRHCKKLDRTCAPSSLQENKMGNSDAQKNGLPHCDKDRSPILQLPKKRRTVHLCYDEDDELPKTPVHGGISLELPSKISRKVPKIVPKEGGILTFSGEKKKTMPKEVTLVTNASLRDISDEKIASSGVRLDNGEKPIKEQIAADAKNSDSDVSMKNLIAAAQERKRQASLHNSSPKPPLQSINPLQRDLQLTSPSFDEFEEWRASSLSGSTTAVLAFEEMIETLSRRNRESILRAARHAMDCAKYGIAEKIVDLLIQKLEKEPNLQSKVAIFFLVDSITKQSHGKKAIGGASYIPSVEAALPRLIAAAAPPGPDAQENRRQCNKVLRLWLERKIFPEHVIRRQMNDIAAANEDDVSCLPPPRHPSRAERSFDDPVRGMEGVDEYGSNATFQFPGLIPSHMVDDEKDEEDYSNPPKTLINEVAHSSPSEQTQASRDTSIYSPNDRHHRILEDIDRELQMESKHHNGKALVSNVSDSLPSSERSPELPLDTPLETPPLPSSPPPQPPPLSSPALSLSPKPLPPPPPLPSSQHQLYTHLPPPPYFSQAQLPPQIAPIPQLRPPLGISPPVPYRPPLPHEVSSMPNVRGEVFSYKQPSFHLPAAVSTAHEHVVYNMPRPVAHGQASQQRPPHLPVGMSFGQRPLGLEPPPQRAPPHFSYLNAAPQNQHSPYPFPNGPNRFVGDDQWQHVQGNEGWISGSGSGYFGTPQERPMPAAVNFHYSATNAHGVHTMPYIPDASSHWRRPM